MKSFTRFFFQLVSFAMLVVFVAGCQTTPYRSDRTILKDLESNFQQSSVTQSQQLNEVQSRIIILDDNIQGLNSKIGALEQKVDSQGQQLSYVAGQLLDEGNSPRWSTPQFGWARIVLSATEEANFVATAVPQIKSASDARPNLIVRVVGNVDRSSKFKNNDGQTATGLQRAAYISKLLKKNGIQPAIETWAFSYVPNRRVVDVYLEPRE